MFETGIQFIIFIANIKSDLRTLQELFANVKFETLIFANCAPEKGSKPW